MSFQDTTGQEFTPQTAWEHAVDLLDAYNAELQAQGLAPIVATQANALWLMMLAIGSKEQTQESNLSAASNSFNLALASNQQISNLLPAAGMSLLPGAATLVTLQVTAAGGTCVVPSGTLVPFGAVNFATASGISIPASGIQTVLATCDTLGPVVVSPNQLTAFGTSIPNLLSVTNPAAGITGRNTETENQARNLLILGDTIGWNLNGVQRAISAIPGITSCKVWFNFDTVDDLVLTGGSIVLPRHAMIVVAGVDSSGTLIASTYQGLMSAPTDGTESQQYTYLSGQVVDVAYMTAENQNLWVKVYYDDAQATQAGFVTSIEEVLAGITFAIGQTVTAQLISEALTGFQFAVIVGAEVSLDGLAYTQKVDANGTAIPVVFDVVVEGV